MYEAFYGLTGKPFQLNPDPSFFFGSSQHRRALAYLEYGLHQNEGFIVVTGEVGAGKTTLVRSLFDKLNPDEVVAAQLVSTQLDADDILQAAAAAFGVRVQGSSKAEVLLSLEAFLVETVCKGRRCLLVVDEAQNLTPRAVEELRMLSNFQFESHALLQSFLIGQPEFREILQSPGMQQLRQRVIASCHIGPMSETETRDYILHRLAHVGWKNGEAIHADAYREIHAATGGIPRRINALCDRLLLAGYLAEWREFTRQSVEEVAREMREEGILSGPTGQGVPAGAAPEALSPAAAQSEKQDHAQLIARVAALEDAVGRIESRLREDTPAGRPAKKSWIRRIMGRAGARDSR